MGIQSALILEAVKLVSQSKSSLEALWAFRIPTCLASFHTTSSYQKKTEMNAKSGQIPGEPDEMQGEEFSKRQIRGPPIPRVQEWSSPHRAKTEFNITDPTAPALGRAPALLISEARDREGESVRLPPKVSWHRPLAAPAPSPSDNDVVRS